MDTPDVSDRAPFLRVVRGNPTPDELAALVAVLAARASSAAEPETPRRSAWIDRSRLMRRPLRPGPGAWRASAWPG